ncbi:MAG TPA: hypothetical protein VIQ54_09655 [Polyangia bacterium]|jgi:hypothetical protein
MSELMTRERGEAKKKGMYAAAAWGGTVVLGVVGLPALGIVAAAGGAGYLTWKWFVYRAKHGIRF